MSFWESAGWHEYERHGGVEPGTRARLLEEAKFRTRVIDLSVPEGDLWLGIRRSYRSLIKRLMRDRLLDVTFLTGEIFLAAAQSLHMQQAGRRTRPQETWDLQADWIDTGEALAIGAWRDDGASNIRLVGFAYSVGDRTSHYYFSGASSEPDVQHLLQWALIRNLKEQTVQFYETGWQGEAQDDKGRAIEFFRRGFGGEDRPAGWRTEG